MAKGRSNVGAQAKKLSVRAKVNPKTSQKLKRSKAIGKGKLS